MGESIIHGNQNTTKLINYLKSSARQYPILTKEEERAMIEANRGDREKLNRLLFMHNIRTVFNQAKAYMSKTNDYDSLVQNGMVGLAEAARRFDIDRDIKFCTYANSWVHKYLSMPYYTAQFKLDMRTVSMNAPTPTADSAGDGVSTEDTLENCLQSYMDPSVADPDANTVESQISANEQHRICQDLYRFVEADNSLSVTDKAVFADMFIEHEKIRDIAEKYSLDSSAVSEIRRRVLDRLRGRLEQAYGVTKYGDIA